MTIQEMQARDMALEQQRLGLMGQKLGITTSIAQLGKLAFGAADTIAPWIYGKGDKKAEQTSQEEKVRAQREAEGYKPRETSMFQPGTLSQEQVQTPAPPQSTSSLLTPEEQAAAPELAQRMTNFGRDADVTAMQMREQGRGQGMFGRGALGASDQRIDLSQEEPAADDMSLPLPSYALEDRRERPMAPGIGGDQVGRLGVRWAGNGLLDNPSPEVRPNVPRNPEMSLQGEGWEDSEMDVARKADANWFKTHAEIKNALAMAAARGDREAVAEILQKSRNSPLLDVAPTGLADIATGGHLDRAREDLWQYGRIDPNFEANRAAINARASASASSAQASGELAGSRAERRPAQLRKAESDATIAELKAKWTPTQQLDDHDVKRGNIATGRSRRGLMATQREAARLKTARDEAAALDRRYEAELAAAQAQGRQLPGDMTYNQGRELFRKGGAAALGSAMRTRDAGPSVQRPPRAQVDVNRDRSDADAEVKRRRRDAERAADKTQSWAGKIFGAAESRLRQQRGFDNTRAENHRKELAKKGRTPDSKLENKIRSLSASSTKTGPGQSDDASWVRDMNLQVATHEKDKAMDIMNLILMETAGNGMEGMVVIDRSTGALVFEPNAVEAQE
jgi:hypothetical protein